MEAGPRVDAPTKCPEQADAPRAVLGPQARPRWSLGPQQTELRDPLLCVCVCVWGGCGGRTAGPGHRLPEHRLPGLGPV